MKRFLVVLVFLLLLAIPAEAAAPVVARTSGSGSTITFPGNGGDPVSFNLIHEATNEDRWSNGVYLWNDTGGTIWINLQGVDVTGNYITEATITNGTIEILSTDTTYGPLIFDPMFTRRISATTNSAEVDPTMRLYFLYED